MTWFSVQTLQEICIRHLAYNYVKYEKDFINIPESMKNRLLSLILKRRYLQTESVLNLMVSTIRKMDLSSINLDQRIFEKLSLCKYLTFINLNSDRSPRHDVTDEGLLTMISGCVHLRNIQLRNCVLITDKPIIYLSQLCSQLENINLYNCQKITDLTLESLSKYSSNLIGINLVKTQITDTGIKTLAESPCATKLKEIQIDGCKSITNKSIELLSSNCMKLYLFTFSNCSNISANCTSTCKFSADVMFFTIQ